VPRPSSIPSDILIHAAIWPQQVWAENWGRMTASFAARHVVALSYHGITNVSESYNRVLKDFQNWKVHYRISELYAICSACYYYLHFSAVFSNDFCVCVWHNSFSI